LWCRNGAAIKNYHEMKLTIREIRRMLFETEKYTVIVSEEMSNKESRVFLYAIEDQDATMNVIDNGTHLLVW
jgi:hypothetical protein